MRLSIPFIALSCLITNPALAKTFDRPIPQAQSATAELWYALACITLIAAMIAVQWLVSRR